MKRTGCGHKGWKDAADCPYKDLYIYYLKGRLKTEWTVVGDSFIGNWQEDEFSFLFFSKPSREKVEKTVRAQPHLILLDEFYMTYEQWQGGKIAPFKIGRFSVMPPWQTLRGKKEACPEELQIILDPGLVFGTGTHTTTRDCLKALELAFSRERIESVLDLGTGTGLLALAATKLGSRQTLAVDLNFLAARTASKNVRHNRLEGLALVVQGRAQDFIDAGSDLVIANINYDVMKHLIASQGFLSKKWFIVSGLLRSQARDMLFRLNQEPVQIIKKWDRDGIWHTFLGKKC
jgi:ribosomal protein L11 methyltransferase